MRVAVAHGLPPKKDDHSLGGTKHQVELTLFQSLGYS